MDYEKLRELRNEQNVFGDLAGVRTTKRTFPPARGPKRPRFGPTTWPIGAPIAPYKPAETSLLYPRQARFFFSALGFPRGGGARLSLYNSSVWHPLAHETVHFPINHSQPNPFLPYLARPRAHHDHQHPMQPTKTPKLGRIRVHDEEAHGAQGWDRGSDPGLVRRRRRRATRATGPRMLLPLFTLILAT